MIIRLTKLSLDHHRLEYVRDDGTRAAVLLDTKAFVPHDLIHYVFEKAAGLRNSFWGLIASGMNFSDINSPDKVDELISSNEEIRLTEAMTGILHNYLTRNGTEEEVLHSVQNLTSAYGIPAPAFVTEDFLRATKAHFRKVMGQWNSLNKDEVMELEF